MKKNITKFSVIMLLCITILSVTCAFAAELTFSDIDNHWAKNEIYDMAGKWIILGYPDGTFKPDDNIIKTHAFLMFARINGYFDTENEVIIDEAIKEYEDILRENQITQGVAEIAFLIYTNVISTEDVIDLLGSGKENELLTREEAAYIYVKLLSDEENLNRFPLVTFDDANNIDGKYLAYVEYVNKIGLMIGVDDNKFEPKNYLTRAQVATILSRVDKIIYERTATKVEGLIESVDLSSNIIELNVQGKVQTYILARDFSVFENDKKVSKTVLKENDKIIMYLDDGTVEKISLNNVEKIVYGTYISRDIDKITAQVENVNMQYLLYKNVNIVKNGKTISINEIKENEKIELTIVNDKVTNILVGAFNYTEAGSIVQIIIGKDSYITIKDLQGEEKFIVTNECDFDFDGVHGSIYDLRLDMDVKLNVTHNGITKVKVETLTNVEVITGLVGQILPNIYVFTVKLDNGQVQMLFLDEEETVIKTKSGIAKSIEDIKPNDLVSIYGRYEGEVFYPIQVIIYE